MNSTTMYCLLGVQIESIQNNKHKIKHDKYKKNKLVTNNYFNKINYKGYSKSYSFKDTKHTKHASSR